MDNSSIKIFMCCHKQPEFVPEMCVPICCGSALSGGLPGVLPDVGENGGISEKNREYCELTAHYYAWKNVSADYYGFCHYRRFLLPGVGSSRPYIVRKSYQAAERSGLFPAAQTIADFAMSHDIIAPRRENMGLSAREHYSTAPYHYPEDLALFTAILAEKFPEYAQAAEAYLAGSQQYFCNMFIMKRELFFRYCETLFPVLEEFDRRKKLHGDFQSDRTDGYLGELFTGIFISGAARRGLDVCEVPRLDITADRKKRLSTALLPPESRARFAVKKLYKLIAKEKK